MGLKQFYYILEDKWYDFVEKTGLYKITDKIDKVMPSFVLCILLMIILIAGAVLLLLPSNTGSEYNQIYFKVTDAETGDVIPGVPVQITTEYDIYNKITGNDGVTEPVGILKNTEFFIDIDYSSGGYATFSKTYLSEEDGFTFTLPVEPEETTSLITYELEFSDDQGVKINKDGSVNFRCAGEGIAPEPVDIINGEASVSADPLCQLRATVYISGYNTLYDEVVNGNSTIYLEEQTAGFLPEEEFSLTMYVKNSSGDNIQNIKTIVKNSLGLKEGECITNIDGVCTVDGLVKGEYTVNYIDNRSVPIYNNLIRQYNIEQDISKYETVTTDVQGYVKIKLVNENTGNEISDGYVALKSGDSLINENYTDLNGEFLFTISDTSLPYRVVADVDGYLIKSQLVEVYDEVPSVATIIELEELTPSSIGQLNVRVLDEKGSGYKFAKVALYDADTGFLTDYQPKITNYDGNVSFNVSSGNYYAVAIKGSSIGQSNDFTFDVRSAETFEKIIVPMTVSKGYLRVNVKNKDGDFIPSAKVDVYDRYSYMNFNPPKMIKSDLSDTSGVYETELDAENEYYVVVSDPIGGNYGATQSRFVYVPHDQTAEIDVILYNKINSVAKPQLKFNGIYKDGSIVQENLKPDEEYKARYTLLVPQNRSGDERIEELGTIIRTGSTVYMENDSIFIKYIDTPFAKSITKYVQFDNDMSDPYEVNGIDDDQTGTKGEAKVAHIVFDKAGDEQDYYNAYQIEVTIKVKDTAVFGEDLKLFSLGYAETDNGYETYSAYTGSEDDIMYFDVYDVHTFSIGEEILCEDDFCYSLDIVDISDNLRYDVDDKFVAKPNKQYKLHFVLINNQKEKKYTDSRLLIENKDEGLEFQNIKIIEPNGDITILNNLDGNYEFDIPISLLASKQKVEGDILLNTKLIGERYLTFIFISDQQIQYAKNMVIDVESNKSLDVKVTPDVIPADKEFSLQVEVTDSQTGVEVEDSYVIIKNRFKDNLTDMMEVGNLGEVSINNIPAQATNDSIYVYVSAPEYETYIEEITVTDKLFSISPKKLAFSLNIHNEKSTTENFTINNLSELDLEVEDIEMRGENLEIIDLDRINNDLIGYSGLVIKGMDTTSDFPENEDVSKNISINVRVNPRAEGIVEVQNLSARLRVSLKADIGNSPTWVYEIPINITVGFDGLLDNPSCLTLSEYSWEEVALNKPVETQFTINNTCTMNSRTVPLLGGLEAKVEFDSNPLGKVIVNVNNRAVELSHGYYKNIMDAFDRDQGYPVIIKYVPEGRTNGEIKGRVIFRSVNNTSSGEQELTSEYEFNINVLSLQDCFVLSKDVLTIYDSPDSFTIENIECGAPTTYRLSCDDCRGLEINPMQGINVDSTGTSREIEVKSFDAVPGAYQINVYSKLSDSRQSERNIGKVKVIVRPVDECIDLDRYEFDLYRSDYSENTGMQVNAKSYDTANIVNVCYQQEIEGSAKVKDSSRLGMAFITALRDGLLTGLGSGVIQGMFMSKDAKLEKALKNGDNTKATKYARKLYEKGDVTYLKSLSKEELTGLGFNKSEIEVIFNSKEIDDIKKINETKENQNHQSILNQVNTKLSDVKKLYLSIETKVTKLYSDPNNNNNNQWVKTKEYSYLETISISKFETDIQSAGYEVSKLNDVLAELKTCESKLKAINSKLDEIISSSQQNTGATNALNKTYEKTQKEEKTVCDGYTNVGEANWAYKCINNTGDYNGCALRNNKPYSKGNIVGPYKFDCNTDPSKYSLSEKWIKQHCCK